MKAAIRAYGALTDAGPAQPLNEDAYLAAPELGLFAVADGFGGRDAGDRAAKNSLADLQYFVEAGMRDSEVTLPFVYRSYYTAVGNLLFNAFLYANQKLLEANAGKQLNGRGGASALAAFFDGSHLTLANAGLCGAMLIRNGRMQTVVRPRSYNAVRGVYQGSWNPRWAFPLVSLGTSKDLEPEIVELKVERGDLVVLATDGIYPRLSSEDFAECFSLLKAKAGLDLAIKQENQRLIEIAQQKGNGDNQALISIICA